MNEMIVRPPLAFLTFYEELLICGAGQNNDFGFIFHVLQTAIVRSLGVPKHLLSDSNMSYSGSSAAMENFINYVRRRRDR